MQIKRIISFILDNISNDAFLCKKDKQKPCGFLYEDKISSFCGIFDRNIINNNKCKECVEILEDKEKNIILKTKYTIDKKDKKILS